MTKQPATLSSTIPIKPHKWYYNPGKYLFDNFFSIIAIIIGPLDKIVSYSTSSTSKETLDYLSKQRKTTAKRWKLMTSFQDYMWSRTISNGGIINIFTKNVVPRKNDILYEWKIIEKEFDVGSHTKGEEGNEDFVNVLFQCPASIIKKQEKKKSSNTDISTIDLNVIDPCTPILVFFYGGAMVLKGSRGPASEFARDLALLQKKYEKKKGVKSSINKEMVTVVIDYHVAPDHPFPAAVIDTLSTIEYIIQNSKSPIHVIGQSAGGNLATVMSLEAHRRYPGRIKSVYLWDPMLNPKADTMSYYMNSLSSGLAPVYFLRWAWRAYLNLDDKVIDRENKNERNNKNKELSENDKMMEMLGKESNRYLVEQCKWYQNKDIWRLCNPISDIPSGLDSVDSEKNKAGPRFLISVAKGDPLHDDGLHFYQKLKENGAYVSFIPCRGSHILAFLMDSKKKQQIYEELRESFFGN